MFTSLSIMTRAISGYGIWVLPIILEDCTEYEQLLFPNPKYRNRWRQ
jgi:hypothetical protein